MTLKDSINFAFAGYGLLYGVALGIAVTLAFFAVEDRILDQFLSQAEEQVSTAIARNADPVLLRGFRLYSEGGPIPDDLRDLPLGRHEAQQYRHVAVFRHPVNGKLLYLVLDETTAEFDRLLGRILFGTLLALVAAVVTGILIARWLSGQLMQPMNTLIERIDRLDFANPELEPLPRNDEIGYLSKRFAEAIDKLNAHDRRERDFTRFASHELRSPITVVRGTASILRSEEQLSARGRRALDRADGAAQRMSRLVEAFLFLGRASADVNTSHLGAAGVGGEIHELVRAHRDNGATVTLDCEHGEGGFVTNPLLLSIVLENLITNAVRHGDGHVSVRIEPPVIVIGNRVSAAAEPGHGFGIEISERICERLGFDLQIDDDGSTYSARLIDTAGDD